MQTLFDNQTYQEVLQRIENLKEDTPPSWGKMTVSQMLSHCQKPLEVANGRLTFTEKPGFIKKMIFKLVKPQMYNDKPWQQNLPTVKDFKVEHTKPFSEAKQNLIESLIEFNKKDLNLHWPKHPFFGEFSTEQWGKMQYKHMDHHLRQFGV